MVANTPGKHFRLNNPAHLTGLIVGGRPSDRLEFITRENCLRVISSQFRANQPGCVIFPSRHLEAGSADEDRNLRSMHVDHQLLRHPSPPAVTQKIIILAKRLADALNTYPQMLWTVGLRCAETKTRGVGCIALTSICGEGSSRESEQGALGEGRLHPHRAKHCGKRGVGRQDRASQTILLIKVSWINSLARACLTTSKRNVGFSR
jgi:hypothetical protein